MGELFFRRIFRQQMIVGHISMMRMICRKVSYDLVFLSLRLGLSMGRWAVLTAICIWHGSHEACLFAFNNVTNQ